MKTPEEILKEKFGTAYKHLNVEQICECIEAYHNQHHPTPTEAEINEAADNWSRLPGDKIIGFKSGVQWIQNYQTQGRAKPVEDHRPLLQQVLDYLHKNVTASMQYEFPHDYTCGEKWPIVDYFPETVDELLNEMGVTLPASQPNPAIAVIEALQAAHDELCQFVPITDISVFNKLTEAINSLKQIKP